MKVSLVPHPLQEAAGDALIVGLPVDEKRLPEPLARLDQALGGQMSEVLAAERFEGKTNQLAHFYTAGRFLATRIIVVGLGPLDQMTVETIRRAAAAGVRRARDLGARTVAIDILGKNLPLRQRASAVVSGAILGTYVFERYKKEKCDKYVQELGVVEPDARRAMEVREAIRTGQLLGEATAFARDLVNAPANEVTPSCLAKVAEQIAREG